MRGRRARGFLAMLVAAALAANGCARLVTLDPDVAVEQNDVGWKIRNQPGRADPAGVQPAASIGGSAPPVSLPARVEPLPFRQRPEIAHAMLSAPDGLGIPVDLYAVDPILSAHRREMESQASSRHAAAGGAFALAVITGAVGVWAVSVGVSHQNDMGPSQTSANQALVWGSLSCVLAVGELVATTVLLASGSDKRPIQSYYRETYTESR